MDRTVLDEVLIRVEDIRVLVVGDFFLDKYLHIDRSLEEISVETGLPAHQVVAKKCAPGAAGVVTANLKAIGVWEVICLGVLGIDGEGFELRSALSTIGARTNKFIISPEISTSTYTKPMSFVPGEIPKEMSRLDIKNRKPLAADIEDLIIATLREIVPQVNGVAISDQVQERNCGVITDRVRAELATLAKKYPEIFFLVDSRTRISEFKGVAIKPNSFEAVRAAGIKFDGEPNFEQARQAGLRLTEMTGVPVFVTVGANGIVLAEDNHVVHIPGRQIKGEIDIVGAGDSCSAGIVAARCCGVSLEDAAFMGNLVASVTVTKIGETGTASPDELRAALDEQPDSTN